MDNAKDRKEFWREAEDDGPEQVMIDSDPNLLLVR